MKICNGPLGVLAEVSLLARSAAFAFSVLWVCLCLCPLPNQPPPYQYAAAAGDAVAVTASPAAAAYWYGGGWFGSGHKHRHTHKTEKAKAADRASKETSANTPKGPLQIFISINQQKLHLYGNGVHVADTSIATGVPSHPTPFGVFSVIQKQVFHRSNIYSNAPMPYMQRITWSGVAM